MKSRLDVLVVGAGPVGLWTALRLHQLGVRELRLIDRAQRTNLHSYALALHSRSLELLEAAGLLEDALTRGHRISRIGLYEGSTLQAELDLTSLPSRHPYVLVLPQSSLEAILEHHLRAQHQPVEWYHELVEATSGPDSVRVRIATLTQTMQGYPILELVQSVAHVRELESRFVIGADGFHSFVRRAAGIEYSSFGEATYYAVFEFRTPAILPDELRLQFDGSLGSALWPMGHGLYRWSFQIDAGQVNLPINPEWFEQLLRSRAPWWADIPFEIVWMSKARFERRLADRFGSGRMWLVGDAAHLSWPFGVQSMNRGLEEGEELAQSIAAILSGNATEASLEAYGARAQAAWEALLGVTIQPEATDTASAWTRAHRLELLYSLPATGKALEALLAQVGLRWQAPLMAT